MFRGIFLEKVECNNCQALVLNPPWPSPKGTGSDAKILRGPTPPILPPTFNYDNETQKIEKVLEWYPLLVLQRSSGERQVEGPKPCLGLDPIVPRSTFVIISVNCPMFYV